MLQSKNQITVRQLMIMFCVSIFSPAIRLMPGIGSELGREAAWVSPILSSAVLFTLFLVLERLFKNKKSKDIIEVYDMVLGKFFLILSVSSTSFGRLSCTFCIYDTMRNDF